MGRVRSLDGTDSLGRRRAGRVLSLTPLSSTGYLKVGITKDRHQTTRTVHSLVLEAFIGPRPEGMHVCHGDGDRTHNALVNLRWDTPSENGYDTVRHRHHQAVLKEACPLGHLLQPFNLTSDSMRLGRRSCLACSRARGMLAYRTEPFAVLAHDRYARLLRGERDGRVKVAR